MEDALGDIAIVVINDRVIDMLIIIFLYMLAVLVILPLLFFVLYLQFWVEGGLDFSRMAPV